MEKRNMQKLNKAAVATVLAASGITISAPAVPTKAAGFTDLDPQADYYKPVLELYNRGYVSGYKDGTFRPNQAVTRGQAAKMLAQALNLNTATPKNPLFRDVPSGSGFYKYVAALANEGIISGYSDKTFRPDEPITRSQMAKIMTLGYKFQQSPKLTHDFQDVSESNPNRFYIQTLYDLGITKGTTRITYSPFGPVTRGQLATFIYRAENASAEAVKPVKEIGGVSGSTVHINGISYRVDASLRGIINETNAAVLKGAHIEGQIIGETLKSISALTINAQGTKDRILTFDGSHTTFAGELVIQGNYLRFKNWSVTGPVTIAETPRRTLSGLANPLQNVRIASLSGYGFIDWTKPTDDTEEDDDPTYNDGGHDLVEKPSILPGGKTVERMPAIEKQVDFSNCSLRRLTIEANRTYVAATTTIPQVTVQGWVRQFEIYANIDTLYLEPDVATTMYGVSDINKIYKNSYKNVHFNSDSHAKLLVVDNAGGKIDLGDNFYVEKTVIPPNKMPNDIFNDFIRDNDKIGDIEDPNGDDVDRDPIGDVIIPDWEEPTARIIKIDVDGTKARAQIASTERGRYYFTALPSGEKPPTIREIMEDAKTTTLKTSGQGMIGDDLRATFDIDGLVEMTDYTLYVVVGDEAGNYSDKVAKGFTTMDGTPPVISGLTAKGLRGGTRGQIDFMPSEDGTYAYYVREYKENNPSMTADEVYDRAKGRGRATENTKVTVIAKDLTPLTRYEVLVVMKDGSGNISEVKTTSFTTTEPDFDPPYVVKDMEIIGPMSEPTTVRITFNEELDPTTAEDIRNYTLGGTGNLKGHPYSAKLINNGKVVELKIPSMAAFVNNDTLTVSLTKIQDLAGNQIIDKTLTYMHSALTKNPTIKNLDAIAMSKPVVNNIKHYQFSFETESSGTFYYLIVPNDPRGKIKAPTRSEILFYEEYKKKYPEAVLIGEGQVSNFNKGTALPTGSPDFISSANKVMDIPVNINKADSESPLNKFTSGYTLYVLLQDRNGKFSEIVSKPFILDEEAPTIKSKSFVGTVTASSEIKENLAGASPDKFYYGLNAAKSYDGKKFFQFRIEFDEVMDKESVEKITNYELTGTAKNKVKVAKATLLEDSKTAVLTLEALTLGNDADYEYNLLHNEELIITLTGIKDASKENVVQDNQIKFTYMDLIPLSVKKDANLIRVLDDSLNPNVAGDIILEMTFSEAINPNSLSGANFTVSNSESATPAPVASYVSGSLSADGKKIKVKLENVKDKAHYTVSVTGLHDTSGSANGAGLPTGNVIDITKNSVVYIYRDFKLVELPPQVDERNWKLDLATSKWFGYVKTIGVRFDNSNQHYSLPGENDIKYKYIVVGKNTTITSVNQIINPTGALDYGGGVLEKGLDEVGLMRHTIRITNDSDFDEGDQVYLVVFDKYGNRMPAMRVTIPAPEVQDKRPTE